MTYKFSADIHVWLEIKQKKNIGCCFFANSNTEKLTINQREKHLSNRCVRLRFRNGDRTDRPELPQTRKYVLTVCGMTSVHTWRRESHTH